jgi:hypothetical protein
MGRENGRLIECWVKLENVLREDDTVPVKLAHPVKVLSR